MPSPVLRWYETDGTTPAGTLTFTPTAGTPTAAQTVRLYNDNGAAAGSDDATELQLTALSRTAGGSNFTADDALAAGGYIEARAVGQGGTGVPVQVTAWTPIGKGRFLNLRDLPSDCYRTIEVRVNAPAGFGTVSKEVLVRALAASPATVIEDGHHESGAVGVCHGVGDLLYSALLEGGTLTETGTPDDNVNIDLTTWIAKGVPWCLVPQAINITDVDGNAASLGVGESYWCALTLASDGTVTQTKGAKGTAPLAVSARPTLPEGEPLLAYVEREVDDTIEQADIYQDERAYGWFAYSAAGLVVTISAGWAMVDNRLIRFSSGNSVTLDASDDSYVWLNPGGTFTANVTGIAPTDRAILLWEFTTDGAGVTAARDRRVFTGRPMHHLSFSKAGNLTASSDIVYRGWAGGSRAYILPLKGIGLFLGGAGATSGSTICDIETSDAGGAFTTVFTSQGSSDQRPTIAQGAANPCDTGARPEVFAIPAWSRLRVVVDAVPGTTSSDLDLELILVAVD